MKLTTTLAILRSHQPCAAGWEKLLHALGHGFPDDKPIDFWTILESNGLDDALWALRGVMPKQEADRDRLARLFACDCAESVLHIYEKEFPDDKRPREAIEVARRFAIGKATRDELDAARDAAGDAVWAAASAAFSAASKAASAAVNAAASAAGAAASAARAAASAAVNAASSAASAASAAARAAATITFLYYFVTPGEADGCSGCSGLKEEISLAGSGESVAPGGAPERGEQIT